MKIGRNDPCWCGSGKKYKSCHAAFDDKLAAYQLKHIPVPSHKLIKTPEQLEGIRKGRQAEYGNSGYGCGKYQGRHVHRRYQYTGA